MDSPQRTSEKVSLGCVAYTSFCLAFYGTVQRQMVGDVQLIDPKPWDELTWQERAAWSTTAVAVRNHLRSQSPSRSRRIWRFLTREVRYTVAAERWEGWGRKGDPRNERAELSRSQWRAAGEPWRMA